MAKANLFDRIGAISKHRACCTIGFDLLVGPDTWVRCSVTAPDGATGDLLVKEVEAALSERFPLAAEVASAKS